MTPADLIAQLHATACRDQIAHMAEQLGREVEW